MANAPGNTVLHYIRRLVAAADVTDVGDGHLLQRFLAQRDEKAFAALVQRYGPLVLSVCRRVLGHEQDAEDAFQATFLVLARKAGSIAKRDSVGSWLFGVALRISQKARASIVRQQKRESRLPELMSSDPTPEWIWREIQPVLDEEVSHLPVRFREPFILCHVQGKSNAEAARQLGCQPATIYSRLARARGLLRDRLARRGLALSTGLLTSLLAENSAQAAVSATLEDVTIRGACHFLVGGTTASGSTSAKAIALAKGEMKTMFLTKLKFGTALVLIGGLSVAGAGAWTYHAVAGVGQAREEKAAEAAARDANGLTGIVRVPSRKDGIVSVIGTEIANGEKVPPERIVNVKINGEARQFRRLKKGDRVEEGQLLAIVDDLLAGAEVAIKQAKLAAARADQVASEKTRDEAKKRHETNQRLFRETVRQVSIEDVRAAELTWERYIYESKSKIEAIKVAEQELLQAQTLQRMSEIRSPRQGIIQKICVHRGEGVHALEPVIIIQVPEDSD